MFRKKLLTFGRTLENDTYGIYDRLGFRLLNRLYLGFSSLKEHKFRHSFAITLNPLCPCSQFQGREHYFLHSQNNLSFCTPLITHTPHNLSNMSNATVSLNSHDLLRIILYSGKSFGTDWKIITASRGLKVGRCQLSLHVVLKQFLFFYKFYDFFCRHHSLMNRRCYNNLY